MEYEYGCMDYIDQQNIVPVQNCNRWKTINKICNKCNKVFPYAYNCRRHMKTCKYPDVKGTFKCSECFEQFYCSDMYFAHLPVKHPEIVTKKHKFEFETHEEFYLWKLKMEKQTASFFKKDYHYKRTLTKVKVVERYHCHRSGTYVSRGTGKRCSKGRESNKCGFYCPAMFTRSVEATGRSFVLFQSTHLGHICEVKLLQQPGKSQNTRQDAGLTRHLRKESSNEGSQNEKLASFSYKELKNIGACYDQNPQPACFSNLKSVNNWVRQVMSCGSNPILLFKGYGEEEVVLPYLEKSDFVVGFMNKVQEKVLTMYGNNIILVDSTGGDSRYGIELTSILVKGSDGVGYPVAFLWSNNLSEKILKAFFNALLERGCHIDCRTFMSDYNATYYSAWCSVFGPAKFNLLCESDVKETWAENASIGPNSIKDLDKRREILNVLSSMQKEMDLKTFKCSLDINSLYWLEDTVTESFGKYFIANFSKTAHMWAACYRDDSTVEIDNILERWHEHLYDINLKVESDDNIDQSLYYIMKSKRESLLKQISSLNDSRRDNNLNEIRKFHKLAKGVFDNGISIHKLSEDMWIVPSFTQRGVVYKVKSLNPDPHNCDLNCHDCEFCLHQFSCSCTDSTIKFELCKHIHLVCLFHQTPNYCFSSGEYSILENENFYGREQTSDSSILSLRHKAQNSLLQFWPCLNSLDSENALREVIETIDNLQKKFKTVVKNEIYNC